MDYTASRHSIIRYTPFILFLFVWLTVILLYSRSYFNIYIASADTIRLLLIFISVFALSYIVFVIYDKNFVCTSFLEINERKIFITIITLCSLSLIGIFFKMNAIANYFNGFDIYFTNPFKIRNAVTHLSDHPQLDTLVYKFSSYLMNFGMISSFYTGIYFVKVKKAKFIILLPIIISILSSFTTFSRFTFVTGIMFLFLSMIFASMFCTQRERRFVNVKLFYSLLIIIAFAFLMILGIFAARTFYSNEIIDLFVETLYFYLTGGISALDHFLNRPFEYTYGASSFRSLASWLNIIGLWPFEEVFTTHNTFTKVSPIYAINTYTFLKSIYQDFGLYGSVIVMVIWAYISKLSIKLLVEKFSVYRLYFSVVVTLSLVMTFFSFYFQGISTLMFWFILLIITENTIANRSINISFSS